MFIISFLKTVPWAAILFDMYRHLSFVCNLSRTTRDFTGLFVVLPVFVVVTDIFRLQRVPQSLCKLIHHLQTPTATMDKQRCSIINQLALEYFPSLADRLFELRPKVKVSYVTFIMGLFCPWFYNPVTHIKGLSVGKLSPDQRRLKSF